MFVKILLVGLLACIHSISSASAPFITKCKAEDSQCLKTSAQAALKTFAKGISELGVHTLDPFFMKTLDASSPNLKLLLKDITGTGLKDCIIKKVSRDVVKSKLFVKLECTVDFEGHYEMNGHLIILPIEGDGRAHVVLRKVVISVDVDLTEKTGKDGQPHWHIKSYKHSYELKDKATIELENLFNGNEVLGRAAKELIASSPNEIIVEVGPPIVKAVIARIVGDVGHFFDHVPASELTL